MKVAIFSDTYVPDINGVASSSHILHDALVKGGHEVMVITTELKKDDEYMDDPLTIRMSGIELKSLYGYRLANIFSLVAMQRIYDFHPDVIHIQTEFSVGIFGKIVAHILDVPVVYTYHTQYEDYVHYAPVVGKIEAIQPIMKKGVAMLSQFLGDDCTELIAPSQKTYDMLKAYGVKNHMHVIPTGLQLEHFEASKLDNAHLASIKEECGILDNGLNLIFLGRIAPEKSVDFVIETLAPLMKAGQPIRFIVVGGGPGLDDLKQLAASLDVSDHIYFAGPRNREEVPYYYHACDVFISASISETQGLTYIEAMATGMPVLARYDKNLEGVIRHKSNGYFFKDENELAQEVQLLLDSDYQTMGKQAYLDSRQYSSEAFYEAIYEVYQDALIHKHFTYHIESISPLLNGLYEVVVGFDRQSMAITLPGSYIESHELVVEKVLDQESFDEMQNYEFIYRGYKRALNLLAVKDYTRQQMKGKLEELDELNLAHIEAIIQLLEEKHLIDDEAYGQSFISRISNRSFGIRHLIHKLSELQLDPNVLERLENNYSRELELAKAEELLAKIYRENRSKSANALRYHASNYLYRKGFEQSIIERALSNVELEVNEDLQKQLLEKAYQMAYKKYAHRFEGGALRQHIFSMLLHKGFSSQEISDYLDEQGEDNGADE